MLTVEHWPLARLIPYARNPRRNDEAVEQMCAAIREFGFRIPIVARSDGSVVDGHLRLKAAQRLELTDVPVALADDLTEAQIKAFRLLANRSAAWAEWDDDLLALELKDLQEVGFDLALTGFDAGELRSLMEEGPATGLTDEDAVPEPPADPVTRSGDLWVLGDHRLLCGDATKAEDAARLLDGARPHLMVTDPPYGVSYDPAWRNAAGVSRTKRTGKVANDDRADWREAWALFPGDVAYVWHGAIHATTVAESLIACGLDIRAQIVWSRSRFALGRGDYHWQHEPCWYAVRKGTRSHWQGARDQSTLWSIAPTGNEDAATAHGTQKPVEAMRRPIVNNSERSDQIYEPFAGSGTTLIAAETIGRVCLAVELDPVYCDVIIERWQRFTGGTAILADSACTFGQLRDQRSAS
ncbi:MAG: putative methylase [Rhodospirillales bacterium]|nr:putative methylase [Rhodospirillales bacterium]